VTEVTEVTLFSRKSLIERIVKEFPEKWVTGRHLCHAALEGSG